MFTGIVEETGTVLFMDFSTNYGKLHIQAKKVLEGTKVGDSIAVNGVCLTVTQLKSDRFVADVMPETVHRSSLGALKSGSRVNLERAMAADGRFGGHMVSGHIDGTGTIKHIEKDGNAIRYQISASENILQGIVEKGSIAIDGISLTVASVNDKEFEISVIPHTLQETILADKREGAVVNLETDIIGKYVKRLLSFPAEAEKQDQKESTITMDFLMRAGF